jgi:hypothetical protein
LREANSRIEQLENTKYIDKLQDKLNQQRQQIDEMEIYSHSDNLVIYGLRETTAEVVGNSSAVAADLNSAP